MSTRYIAERDDDTTVCWQASHFTGAHHLYTTRRLLQVVPSPANNASRTCCCRGAFCCCDAPGAPCCSVVGTTGISTQRYIFGILALLVVVFAALFYMCMAMRYMRYGVSSLWTMRCEIESTHTHRRRRYMRTLQAQADAEAAQRHKELLELVERACSVPPAVGKSFSVDVKSVDLESRPSAVLSTPSSTNVKLYLMRECPVCLDDIQDYSNWRAFRCGHGICYPCLSKAVSHVTTLADVRCPICREHVVEGAGEEEGCQAEGHSGGAFQEGSSMDTAVVESTGEPAEEPVPVCGPPETSTVHHQDRGDASRR